MVDRIEIPSDIEEIVYVPFDEHGAWRTRLLQKLNALGHNINWQKEIS
jgi:hypothetical protein